MINSFPTYLIFFLSSLLESLVLEAFTWHDILGGWSKVEKQLKHVEISLGVMILLNWYKPHVKKNVITNRNV